MPDYGYLEPYLSSCKLCEWRCGVDRLSGEIGICGITTPKVGSSQLHPAPPASFDAFLVGCNFKCLFCQNWTISMFDEAGPQINRSIEGYYDPATWAELGVTYLTMPEARQIGADRLFFTGGSVKPVLRNLKQIMKTAPEKLWELRVMVIPGVHEFDMDGMCKFLVDIDPEIKLNFLAFRPNFVMSSYPGVTVALLDQYVNTAQEYGLVNSSWSGRPGIYRKIPKVIDDMVKNSELPEHIAIPVSYAKLHGCKGPVRNCGKCKQKRDCIIRKYCDETQ